MLQYNKKEKEKKIPLAPHETLNNAYAIPASSTLIIDIRDSELVVETNSDKKVKYRNHVYIVKKKGKSLSSGHVTVSPAQQGCPEVSVLAPLPS